MLQSLSLLVLIYGSLCWCAMDAADTARENYKDAIAKKTKLLESAAVRAMQQQRKGSHDDIPLTATWSGAGKVSVEESSDWDVDGDGKSYKITVSDISNAQRDKGIKDLIQIRFDKPVDALSKSTGMGMWIKTDDAISPDLRFGVYFKGNEADPIVFTDIPIKHKFSDNPHKAYIDWGFVFNNSCGVMKTPKNEFWKAVEGFDLAIAHRRLPADGKKLEPTSATFYIDGLVLEDIYDGSYDSQRFPKNGFNASKGYLIAQGRTQQVARICAAYGGDAGRDSAIRAMDMMTRLQCWDGSWPEWKTRLQGEFTHGMIVADLAYALGSLREHKHPALKERVKIRHYDATREEIYEKIIYRGAMSRAPGPISKWKDTYCSGKSGMLYGANRPMVLIFSQWVAAQQMSDPKKKKAILDDYNINMDDLISFQGKTAGGWPIFGEGNAHKGKGINFDLGYTMDHVYIMAYASRVTNDKRWGDIIRKFDEVVKVMILKDGVHFDGPWHERKSTKSGGQGKMKVADLVYQESLRQNAPYFTQWSYNTHAKRWANFPQKLWAYTGTARGYGLGAFLTWQCYDMQYEPIPSNPGIYFPRQWPIHSAAWHHKDGRKNVRKTLATLKADGSIHIPFKWELGEYPEIHGLPLALSVSQDVDIEVLNYSGIISSLSADEQISVKQDGKALASQAQSFASSLKQRTTFEIQAKNISISFVVIPKQTKGEIQLKARVIKQP